jgi:hypothetical protein
MQIPESIEKITKEVPPSALVRKEEPPSVPLDEIIFNIKKTLDIKSTEYFEKGLVYMKNDLSSDKQIIKNYINLINDCMVGALKNSDVNEDYKSELITNFKIIVDSLKNIFDSTYNTVFILNKQKNLLDSKEITFTILGYAIGIIKKIYNR